MDMDAENPLVIYSDSFYLTLSKGSSSFIQCIEGTLETGEKTPDNVGSLDSASCVLLRLECLDASKALHVVSALKDSGFIASTDKISFDTVLLDCQTVSDVLQVMKRLDEEMILSDSNQDLAVTVAASAKKLESSPMSLGWGMLLLKHFV